MIYQPISEKGLDKKHTNAAIFYAHPDDETIFMGGTILNHPDWFWDLYCFTYTDNSIRGKELKTAISTFQSLGVKHINFHILGFDDSKDTSILENDFGSYISTLQEINKNKEFDLIFTHNEKGDYGHPQHIMVNKAVREVFRDTTIWEFICLGAEKIIPAPILKDIMFVQLDHKSLESKLKVFESYPSQMSSWKDLFPIMNYEFKIGIEIFTKM